MLKAFCICEIIIQTLAYILVLLVVTLASVTVMASRLVYGFTVAIVTNYYKLSGLEQYKFTL